MNTLTSFTCCHTNQENVIQYNFILMYRLVIHFIYPTMIFQLILTLYNFPLGLKIFNFSTLYPFSIWFLEITIKGNKWSKVFQLMFLNMPCTKTMPSVCKHFLWWLTIIKGANDILNLFVIYVTSNITMNLV